MSSINDPEQLTGSSRIYANAKPGIIMDAFSMAGFGDSAEQIKLQRRMPVTVFRIIRGIALIAACVPCPEVNPAGLHLIRECLHIKFRPDIGDCCWCVEVVEQPVLELRHEFNSLFFMGFR